MRSAAKPQTIRSNIGAVLRRSTAIASVTLAVSSGLGSAAMAQTWTGSVDGNYNNTGNWSTSTVPAAGDTAAFDGTGANRTLTLGVANSADAWTISGGQIYSIGGGGSIDLSSGLTNTATVGQSVNLSILGTGSVVQNGPGTLTLFSAGSTYTGDTVINGGTLRIFGGDAIGDTSAVQIANTPGATLEVQNFEIVGAISGGGEIVVDGGGLRTNFDTITSTYSGVISGSSFINKGGTGTLVLTGNNTYAGGLGVLAGTVIGNVAALPGNIFNSGTVVFDQASNATYAGNIDTVPGFSAGQMVKRGAGALVLSGTNTLGWTIDAGTLTSDANRFSGDVATAVGTSFILDQASAGTYSNVVSGLGGLQKTGAGTLTLTGANTYTGDTVISNGLLVTQSGAIADTSAVRIADTAGAAWQVNGFETVGAISGGGASGGTIDIVGAGTGDGLVTRFDNVTETFAGTITGAGYIVKEGTGTLVLTGLNSYGNGLGVRGGTVIGNVAALPGNIFNSATVVFDQASDATYAGNINYVPGDPTTGQMIKRGAGSLILSGSSILNWTVDAGNLTSDANRFNGNVATAAGATFTLDQSSAGTFSKAISGAGGFTKTGAGSLILSGTNTYTGATTINGGTLDVRGGNAIADASAVVLADAGASRLLVTDSETIGSLAGGGANGGNVEIASGAQLDVGGVSGRTIFAGALSGAGSLSLDGGFTKLTGDSSGYLGTTQVASTLSVDGVLGGRLTILPGGRLQGNGTVGDTVLSAGSTIAPGNSIGTLGVNGNLTFNAASLYQVEVGATGLGDRINVSGTAALNDASVQVIALDPTASYRNGQAYTILTAGTIDGRFSPVIATDSAFINSSLTYSANDVILNVQTALLNSVAGSFNQLQTANALDSLSNVTGSADLAFYNTLLDLNADEARRAFDSLSGEVHASVQTGLIEESRHVRDAALSRLDAAFAAPTIASTTSGPNEGAAQLGLGAGAWISGYGSWGETDGNGNAGKLDRDVGGVLVGADVAVGDASRLGFFTGYSHSDFDIASRSSKADVDSYHLGIYGGTELGAILLKAGAAYSWNDVETSRSVAFTGFSDALSADYDSGTAQVFGEASYRFELAQGRVEPFVNLAYVNLDTDGFRENGGIAALSVSREKTDTTFSTLGLRASTALSLGGMDVSANGMLGWRHAYDGAPTSTLAFVSGNSFTVAGAPIAEDAAVVELGLGVAITPSANIGLRYTGQFGKDVTDNGVTARLSVDF